MSSLRYRKLRPQRRTRPFSLSDIKSDVVVGTIARMELKRHLQTQANRQIRETLTGNSDEPEKSSGPRLTFSRAPRISPPKRTLSPSKPMYKSLSCRISPRPVRTASQLTLHPPKWISPFDRRDIVVLPRSSNPPDLTLVASHIPSQSARSSPVIIRRTPVSDGDTQTSGRLHHIVQLPKTNRDFSNFEALGRRLRTVMVTQGTMY